MPASKKRKTKPREWFIVDPDVPGVAPYAFESRSEARRECLAWGHSMEVIRVREVVSRGKA